MAQDQTVAYNGTEQFYDVEQYVSCPDGWTVDCSPRVGLTKPGTLSVLVRFTHELYYPVVKEVTFTVTKATYTGDDLVAESVTGVYDGVTVWSIEATAGEGWEIFYSTNDRRVAGVTTVTVTFTHDGYETVTKTVTITVTEQQE